MFASAGGGTVAGALKSGQSAVGNAETIGDVAKLAKSVGKSKVLTFGAKAQLFSALADKAQEIDPESDHAVDLKGEAFQAAVMGKENEDWADVEDPATGDTVPAQLVHDGKGGVYAVLESGESVEAPPGVVMAAKDAAEAQATEALGGVAAHSGSVMVSSDDIEAYGIEEAVSNMLPDAKVEVGEDDETVTVTTPDGKVYAGTVGTDSDELELKEVGRF